MIAALRNRGDVANLRARATVLDVTVREPFAGDTVNVRLDHRAEPAIDILVPYRSTPGGSSVSTDSLSAARDTPRLWPDSAGQT